MATAEPEELLRRLKQGDPSLWPEGNIARTRLGWLEVPREMERGARELRNWASTIDEEEVILLGMGGSALGALVFDELAMAFDEPHGRRIHVCDTTEPSSVQAMPFEEAFILVSSKSGTTLETNVLFDYALTRQRNPRKYAVITDEGTPLARRAAALRINRVFSNRADIGGRYSVLSYFGLVPAALGDYDIDELVGRALELDAVEAVELGLSLAEQALGGADKLTIELASELRSFGSWLEQLLAESTGKDGVGIVPIPTSEREIGPDRQAISVGLKSAHEVGAEFYRFEIAVAIAGHGLAIDPFDEPNVAESKENTAAALKELPLPGQHLLAVGELPDYLEATLQPGDYVSLQAYIPFGVDEALEALRRRVRDANDGVAVSAGYGPRFLHSTGQLHKGGPNSVVAVQILPREARPSLAVPDKPYDFATLIDAQAIGDLQSLERHGRRVVRVAVDDLNELF